MPTIDLNSDLGESYGAAIVGDDAAIMPLVTSANLACGAHGGDPATMAAACAAAVAHGVAIGAHPSYDDRAGFGRRDLEVEPVVLAGQLRAQVSTLRQAAEAAGGRVRYLKPHGALYNRIVHDEHRAAVVAEVAAWAGVPLMGMPGTAAERAAAAAGIPFLAEGFADRAYRGDGSLVPRSEAGAVLHDPGLIAARAVRLAREGVVETIEGELLPLRVRSLCVHGDTPGAVAIARAVRSALRDADIALEPLV
ncbi:LamB/YcsF family protein [Microcella daejeonensis]|uniref:LamB/YcsF family protein n=1 Tax=Microcella daejeonensis TaxID=2994971 RepID=UPI00226DE4D7|nr:5-oxoprolinase subunit PxpA [Microcella daejeonensis]WAB84924.1 LamB/YcsF family protein [Microcella daejeonensis]